MKHIMRISPVKRLGSNPLIVVCALFAGCAELQLRYSEYTGHDAGSHLGTWPTGGGSMAETSYAIPVYRGWPEKPYQVLGSLSFPDPNARWDDGIINAAAKEAKKRKADAIIIRQGAELGVSKIADARTDPLVVSSSDQTTALVVRWLPEQEIRARELRVVEFLRRFSANEPTVSANRNVAEMVIVFLLQRGFDLNSPEFFDRFGETMTKLVSRTPESLAGDWVFRATLSVSTLLSGGDERNSLGLATVSVDGEHVAIVSNEGRVEMNFAGTMSSSRVTGQIGIAGFSVKCEGVATTDKISINFQSLTPDGTLHGNVVLQRLPANPKHQ
ncbi:MAG: hypothetical protein ACYDH9_20965 [Limisphaerales bacterium]